MSIFEDWIDELKEENLLERTDSETLENKKNIVSSKKKKIFDDAYSENKPLENLNPSIDVKEAKREAVRAASAKIKVSTAADAADKTEFFRKRAVAEVGGLQTVEHIFCGVERQQKKLAPKVYDDLNVKKALHEFLQISDEADSSEHTAAEFQLRLETESWYSALSHRDKQISIADLRRYCETMKPALSAQALVELARFYRNSPYSEAVRSKFDLIATRLFTREKAGETREIVFERDDLMQHLTELYAEWESISLYSNGEKDEESAIVLHALKFEDLMSEAEDAASFDALVKNDFFNRLRKLKESTNERFFAPLVTATAVESNVRIGNRYVELLEREKEKGELEKLENKYGFLHDQVISDATSKTLQLVELLKLKVESPAEEEAAQTSDKPEIVSDKIETETAQTPAALLNRLKTSFLAVNKLLLGAAFVVLLASVAVYIWAEYNSAAATKDKISQDVKLVNVDNWSVSEFIKDARVGNNTFFAVVKPAWSSLNREKKEEVLKKIAAAGVEKNFKNVRLVSLTGETVGTAADGVVEVGD